LLADEAGQSRRGQSALEAERGDVGVKDYPVHDGSGEVCVTHLGDMSEEGVQFLVGVEDAILSEIVGRPDGANALALRLFIE
jgi:hypothetical protein